jgi:hypothetical protein
MCITGTALETDELRRFTLGAKTLEILRGLLIWGALKEAGEAKMIV